MLAFYRYRFLLASPSASRATHALPELTVVRGAWGAALRRLACATGAPTCVDCRLARNCGYRAIFDPLPPPAHALGKLTNVPPAYVLGPLEPEQSQQGLQLELSLLQPAQQRLGLVIAALQEALHEGLGRQRTRHSILRIEHYDGHAWHPITPRGELSHSGVLTLNASSCNDDELGVMREFEIVLKTPVRLQDQGKAIGPAQFTPRRWLMHLARRLGLLADLYGQPLGLDFPRLAAYADQVTMPHSRLEWSDGERWSSRQGKTHPMGGVLGRFHMRGPLTPFLPLLHAGQWLHVGKHAAFGQGRYQLADTG